jgi:homopolymeric O-antigen transport system permease protein
MRTSSGRVPADPLPEMRTAAADVVRSARLWPIWIRLGIQDVRLRFRRSAIGVAWIFVNLAVLVLAIGFIYANLLGQSPRTFIPYLTIGLILWGYLTNSIVEGGNAFINSEGYIKQISLPIYVYLFRAFVSIGLTAIITLCAFVLVAILYGVPVGAGTLLVVPGLVLLMSTSLLLITIFAHLNTRFRDVAHMASVGMQVLFYVTPVIFPADLLRRRRNLSLVVELNPMYHLLEVVRRPLLAAEPADWRSYVVVLFVILVLSGVAAAVIGFYQRRIVFAL